MIRKVYNMWPRCNIELFQVHKDLQFAKKSWPFTFFIILMRFGLYFLHIFKKFVQNYAYKAEVAVICIIWQFY